MPRVSHQHRVEPARPPHNAILALAQQSVIHDTNTLEVEARVVKEAVSWHVKAAAGFIQCT